MFDGAIRLRAAQHQRRLIELSDEKGDQLRADRLFEFRYCSKVLSRLAQLLQFLQRHSAL